MAGNELVRGKTVSGGGVSGGLPLVTVVANGNVQEGDEWALFRMTDAGLSFYNEGPDFQSSIMSMQIDGRSAVDEVPPRHKSKEEAIAAWGNLSTGEQARTLVRSVRPR